MGKARRLKEERRRLGLTGPGEARLIENEADLMADPGLLSSHMPARLTYLNDPVFGGMHAAIGVGSDGRLVADGSGTDEPIPVILFEPAKVLMSQNQDTGLVQELRTEAIVAAGFHRMPPAGPIWSAKPAAGWEVRRESDALVLRDGTGDTWASTEVSPEPRWVSAAVSYRDIIVFFGPRLGVRVPPGTNPAKYTDAARAAEFHQAREYGLVSVATVKWRSEASSETLSWITFLPGSFGQPLPGIFAPAPVFSRHGGPPALGLNQITGPDTAVTLTRHLTARVTRTALDLMDPAGGQLSNWIGGVHYDEGIDRNWSRAARQSRLALLVTGPKLPDSASAGELEPLSPADELWAALVPINHT